MADPTLAYIILGTIITLILGAIFYLQRTVKQGELEEQQRLIQEQPAAAVAAGRVHVGHRPAANRNVRARLRAALAERRGEELSLEEEPQQLPAVARPLAGREDREAESDEEGDQEIKLPKANIGKKKAAKLQAKAEKREQRLAEEREREEKKARDALKAEEEKKKQEEEEAEEARRLEDERRLQEEKERREQEDYEKMKATFSVEESGFDVDDDENAENNLLKEFVDYIKREKVVVLEELAARFRLRTQAVINRVMSLQDEGTLTGVLDDRGKFIYISMEELEGIARFIRQRGRVSLAELAEASGSLVSLSPEKHEVTGQA